jgi:MerR family copper efflux transcriptional regulator
MKLLYPFELARLAGVSTDTLRYYDRRGLLPNVQRSKSGYRLFPVESLNRVRLVRRALSTGFSVNELTDILRERDHGGAPCQRVRKLAAEKLVTLDAQLRELQSRRRLLRSTLAGWDRILSRTAHGQRAELLERLPQENKKETP